MVIAAPTWWSKDTVAVVTGSSKGIGLQIVKDLAKAGITTVVTARDAGRSQKVVDSLKAEGLDSVVFHPLEVTIPESVDNLVTWLKKEFGGVDILINNAGTLVEKLSYEGAKETLDTNYYAVQAVISKLLPVLRPGARIVNMRSSLGQLSLLQDETLVKRLSDEEHLTVEVVDSVVSEYLEDVKAGISENKWSRVEHSYSESKMFLGALTRALAKTLLRKSEKNSVSVNVVHPGYIQTDMTVNLQYGKKSSVAEGADTPVWLALLPEENYPNGKFFFNREPFPF